MRGAAPLFCQAQERGLFSGGGGWQEVGVFFLVLVLEVDALE